MTETDKQHEPVPPPEAGNPSLGESPSLSRRRFLIYLLAITGAIGAGGLAAPLIRYAYPVGKTQVALRQEVGTLSALEPLGEAIEFDYQSVPAALILLADGKPIALSRVCTHLGCIVGWEPDNDQFFCPCHAGVFSPEGEVLAGPPPRPLPQMNVIVEGDTVFVEGWMEA